MPDGDVPQRFGRCSDAFGPNPVPFRADPRGSLAKPLSRVKQGTAYPLVSGPRFGRRLGSRFGRANPADAGREKALSFLLIT